jgi:transposase
VLATSLLDAKGVPALALKTLYGWRWGIETYYDRLKNSFEGERFSGRTVRSIEQDVFGGIFLTTLESVLSKAAEAELARESAAAQRKHVAQVNHAVSYLALVDHTMVLIEALHQPELIAPFVFEGTCNTALFEAYGAHGLVPVRKPGQIGIYDNARFHQSAKARQLIAGAGCTQKFLPPYSPDLNPIEHYWFPLKQRIRNYLPLYDRDLHKTMDAVLTQRPSP